jgi:hypothetical protein
LGFTATLDLGLDHDYRRGRLVDALNVLRVVSQRDALICSILQGQSVGQAQVKTVIDALSYNSASYLLSKLT